MSFWHRIGGFNGIALFSISYGCKTPELFPWGRPLSPFVIGVISKPLIKQLNPPVQSPGSEVFLKRVSLWSVEIQIKSSAVMAPEWGGHFTNPPTLSTSQVPCLLTEICVLFIDVYQTQDLLALIMFSQHQAFRHLLVQNIPRHEYICV